MRLIEVAGLEKFIQENVCAIGNDHLLLVAGDDGRWHEALPLIKTAYDVDKVVEELNELDVKSITRYKNGNFGNFDGVEYYIKKRKAIEIVKQGGVSDDVCEWKDKELYGYYTSCTEFRSCIACKDTYWKYCPYCGKKIKVVE